jgi:hypothetical protein
MIIIAVLDSPVRLDDEACVTTVVKARENWFLEVLPDAD